MKNPQGVRERDWEGKEPGKESCRIRSRMSEGKLLHPPWELCRQQAHLHATHLIPQGYQAVIRHPCRSLVTCCVKGSNAKFSGTWITVDSTKNL